MEKFIFIIAVSLSLTANAQNYLITFTGTGASTIVSRVKVENLTKGTTLTFNGSDKLLLTSATHVNPVKDNQSGELKIYPNPVTDNATVEIYPPVAGDAIISICDMTGKEVAQIKSYLEKLRQVFKLTGIKKGFYLVNVTGNNYQLSGKLISKGNHSGTMSIEKVNISVQTVDEKAVKTESKGTYGIVYMVYNTGERLKFTGTSEIYSTVKTDIPASGKTINFNFIACTDGDNNNYPVVEIGTQIWMAENLRTTRYSHGGNPITEIKDNNSWSTETGRAYCWYNNDSASYKDTYGALYNWFAVEGKVINPFKPWYIWYENICPTGWRVPSKDQWAALTTYLGVNAGLKLKETGTGHWESPNTGATNETGFSALPGGERIIMIPFAAFGFSNMGKRGAWWSSSEYGIDEAWFWGVGSGIYYGEGNYYNRWGFSIRCIKDN
jgi:uncharacterized protein (TIGR02145 family)